MFALGTMSHAYLEFDIRPGVDADALVRGVASLREPRTTIGGVNLVVAFRPELWLSVARGGCPSGLAGFNEPRVGTDGYILPATQHDAEAWEAMPVSEQELVIGRRKVEGDELDPRPPTSHVTRTDQERFGRIFRRNIGYGTLTRHGTIFVGFSRDRQRLDAMLDSMIGGSGEARDRLTAFAHALTGGYYFVPPSEALAPFAGDSST
jgi:Dyp-type peroxidase family